MAIFRASAPEIPLIVSVTGVRLGQRVLVVPGRDRQVLFDLATRVGLTGRTLALVAGDEGVARLQRDTERAGIVADVDGLEMPLPIADESFDLAVVDDRVPRADAFATAVLLPALRASLRPGGRIVVLLDAGGGVVARLLGRSAPPRDAPALLGWLVDSGFRTGRLVATRNGVGYVEAHRAGA